MKSRISFTSSVTCLLTAFLLSGWSAAADSVPTSQPSRIASLDDAERYFTTASDSWPRLCSPLRASGLPEPERVSQTAKQDTLYQIIAVFAEGLPTKAPATEVQVRRRIAVGAAISRRLQTAGGYTNHVFADSLNRILLADLCYLAVDQPKEYATCLSLLQSIPTPAFPRAADIASLLTEEGTVANATIASSPEDRLVDAVFAACGRNYAEFLGGDGIGRIKNSDVMATRDIPALAYRMAETDMVATVYLPALLEYLKRGGRLEELTTQDITPFNRVMGTARKDFKCPVAGVKQAKTSHLLTITAGFRRPSGDSNILLRVIR